MTGPVLLLGDDDAFGAPEEMSDEEAERWADALDTRASSPDQRALRALAIEAAGVRQGQAVGEIGCGTREPAR